MLLIASVTVIILTCCLLLHYNKHFKFRFKCSRKKKIVRRRTNVPNSSNSNIDRNSILSRAARTISTSDLFTYKDTKYRCIFTFGDNQEYDFFPIAYFFYLLFLLFICGIIIAKCFIFDLYYDYDMDHYFIKSYKQHFNKKGYSSVFTHNTNNKLDIINILDWILVYCIMILSIWESFFAFYRYYTTLYSTKSYVIPTIWTVIQKFLIYGIIFTITYVAEIHVSYWLFIVVVLLHCVFNIYCNLKFASLLINKYTLFITMGDSTQNKESNKNILRSIYFMRKTSLICAIIQSLYLSLFVITYNINITYYIPILWGISATIFTLNFVRNRDCIYVYIFECFWKFKHNKYCIACEYHCNKLKKHKKHKSFSNNNPSFGNFPIPRNKSKTPTTPSNPVILDAVSDGPYDFAPPNTNKNLKMLDQLKIIAKHDQLASSSIHMKNPIDFNDNPKYNHHISLGLTSPSVPVSIARASIIRLPPKSPDVKRGYSEQYIIKSHHFNRYAKKPRKKKAFAILGLTETISNKTDTNSPVPIFLTDHHGAQTAENGSGTDNEKVMELKANTKNNRLITLDNKLHLNMTSVSVPIKHVTFSDKNEEKQDSPIITMNPASSSQKTGTCTPQSPLIIDANSNPNPYAMVTPGVQPKNGNDELLDDQDAFVFFDDELKYDDIKDDKDDVNPNAVINTNANVVKTLRLKLNDYPSKSKSKSKSKGQSQPSPSIDVERPNLDEVVRSLNVFVAHGFCSRVSVNNVKQLQLYRDQEMSKIDNNDNK